MQKSHYNSLNIVLVQAREAVLAFFRPHLNHIGITEQQWRIIRLLQENGTLDFQDLAKKACILRPSLTGILTRLENMDLVVRLKPTNDQRRVYIKLTPKGEQIFKQIVSIIDEGYRRIETHYSREKMDELRQLLNELILASEQVHQENQENQEWGN